MTIMHEAKAPGRSVGDWNCPWLSTEMALPSVARATQRSQWRKELHLKRSPGNSWRRSLGWYFGAGLAYFYEGLTVRR